MNKRTKHQEEKLRESLSILSESNRLLIRGSAGVGKTFMVNDLVLYLGQDLEEHKTILCSAPTHKALSVLKQKVTGERISFKTVHAALFYKVITNLETGERTFEPRVHPHFPPLKSVAYWVIDEVSMVPSEMLENIEYYAKAQGTTVIFIGDDKQLNPVEEEESPVFHQGYPEVELTEIVRQGEGNPIIEISRELSLIYGNENKITEDNKGFLYTYNESKIIEELSIANGTNDFKYLAWSNQEVNRMNDLVRKKIYGENPARIEKGETIVFDSPYKIYHTNQELLVEEVLVSTVLIRVLFETGSIKKKGVVELVPLKVYVINPSGHFRIEDKKGIVVIHEDSEKDYKKIVSRLNLNCRNKRLDYRKKNEFTELFADFKYNHALTIHKSQGSTYKVTVLNIRNINLNCKLKEKQRLLYTGVTRASDLLILYNV